MDKDKLIKTLKENKKEQVDKYVDAIKKIIKNNPEYYNGKEYSRKFK